MEDWHALKKMKLRQKERSFKKAFRGVSKTRRMTNTLVDTTGYENVNTSLWEAGLSLRELIHEYKYQTLVLFKCCLLQPKVLSLLRTQGFLDLILLDALLRITMRTSLHGPICFNFFDTRTAAALGRLCRSRIRFIRKALSTADIAENQ